MRNRIVQLATSFVTFYYRAVRLNIMAVTLGTNQSISHHLPLRLPSRTKEQLTWTTQNWQITWKCKRQSRRGGDFCTASLRRCSLHHLQTFLQWNTHTFVNLDRRSNWQDSKGFGPGGWVGAWVPVSCQAAGGSRAKRLRQCDWAAVTLARSILTLFCCGSVLCERNFSCLNWCQTIWCMQRFGTWKKHLRAPVSACERRERWSHLQLDRI